MTGNQLAVPARRVHHRQTGSHLAVKSDPAAVESVASPVGQSVERRDAVAFNFR